MADMSSIHTRTFPTEVDVASLASSVDYRSRRARRSLLAAREAIVERVEDQKFVFNEKGNRLPGDVQLAQLVESVAATLDIPSSNQEWKRMMLTDESTSVIQDSFWWIFLDEFSSVPEKSESKDDDRLASSEDVEASKERLENRMAEKFVYLLIKLKSKLKGKSKDSFLQKYPDAVAQSLYLSMSSAYPKSKAQFDDYFKRRLVDQIFLWMSGFRPSKPTWAHWLEDINTQERTKQKGAYAANGRSPAGSPTSPPPSNYKLASFTLGSHGKEEARVEKRRPSTLAYASRGVVSTRYLLNHSPLVERYLASQGCSDSSKRLAVSVTLSEYPNETLRDGGDCKAIAQASRVRQDAHSDVRGCFKKIAMRKCGSYGKAPQAGAGAKEGDVQNETVSKGGDR